jgi:allophanate hydrolase
VGLTLAAPAGRDLALLELAARVTGGEAVVGPQGTRIPVVVCGAHLEGLALHHQLAERGAVLRWKGETAGCYRLYAMPGGGGLPPRPALVRDEAGGGVAIAVEVWELEAAAFGTFVAGIPAPLGIGKVELATGEQVPGFIAEPRAVAGAEEITSYGGWRAWMGR